MMDSTLDIICSGTDLGAAVLIVDKTFPDNIMEEVNNARVIPVIEGLRIVLHRLSEVLSVDGKYIEGYDRTYLNLSLLAESCVYTSSESFLGIMDVRLNMPLKDQMIIAALFQYLGISLSCSGEYLHYISVAMFIQGFEDTTIKPEGILSAEWSFDKYKELVDGYGSTLLNTCLPSLAVAYLPIHVNVNRFDLTTPSGFRKVTTVVPINAESTSEDNVIQFPKPKR